jgi:uncharacterized alkaline shock family protein YloU
MTNGTRPAITGELRVTDGVIADLIGYAALESYGVVGMTAPKVPEGIARLLPTKSLRKGVVVNHTDDGLDVALYIVIEHGTNLASVSKNLQDRVHYVLEEYINVQVSEVTIHVQGVHVQKG